ncbi:MAG: potassium channel protein [Desulfobacula sp.]|uniref:potassium channel family protein n=1 Tax=Desulfobacula sp. TaxID=2593537 RepID=UPI0025BD187F|nr:potassium channel protein [Desulfobacula sp.]MCD4722273.1 potassium channel protein [Desulfobacula sp.]
MNRLEQITRAFLLSWIIFLIGVGGYMVIEKWDFLDAAYMTAITLSTVGFMEVHETTPAGKIFTIIMMLAGVGYFLYIAGVLVQSIVEGELQSILGRKMLDKKISRLRNHYIICGYGRIGRVLCHLIKEETNEIVVIDNDDTLIDTLDKDKTHYLQGDASDEDLLAKAGINNASFLVAALGTDTANVFLVLTARQLNPDIYIMARASNPDVKKKLMIAGANFVESPYDIGAISMGLKLLRPNVSSFLEVALSRKGEGIQIDEIFVPKHSRYTNIALKDSGIRQDFNLIIISIRKASGEMLFNPHFETLIESDDIVIVMGKSPDLKKFAKAINTEKN